MSWFQRRFEITLVLVLALTLSAAAQNQTLRINYTFSGNSTESHIYLDDLNVTDGWAGRRVNMKELYLEGNGQIMMTEVRTGDTLYRNSFSTLFQEWQNTEEATQVSRSFENVFLLPMPVAKAVVEVKLTDNYNKMVAVLRHTVDPEDILIRGVSFRRQQHVDEMHAFGFGAPAPGTDYPALYMVGNVDGVRGFFRSDDCAASWVRINDDNHQYGLVLHITGDPKKYGRVYVGTHGRGAVYGDPR